MEPRFTRGEYWLLETVVEGGRPFVYVHARDSNLALNKQGHGLDRASLADTLERLFDLGLIGAARLSEGGCLGPFTRRLCRAEIEAALDETRSLDDDRGDSDYDETYYGLTPEGGRQWEAFAAPRWGQYVERHIRPSRSGRWNVGVLISADRARVERLLEGARYMGHIVDKKHIHRKLIRPWQVTYWKQLPQGHLVNYRFDKVESNYEFSPYWFTHLYDNRQWCRWI